MLNYYYSTDGTSYTDITSRVISGKWSKNKDMGQNKFDILLDPNILGNEITKVESGQFIKITNGSSTEFVGNILKFFDRQQNKRKFTQTGADASLSFFGGQKSESFTSMTASDIIIQLASSFSSSKNPMNASLTTSGGYVTPTTKVIPKFYGNNKRFFEYATELCMTSNTGESKVFTFYIDGDNNLHFEPLGSSSNSINEKDILDSDLKLNPQNRFNNVVINCGTDSTGKRINAYFTDALTIAKMEGHVVTKYFDESWIADKILQENPSYNDTQLTNAAQDVGKALAQRYIMWHGRMRLELEVTLPGIASGLAPAQEISTDIDIAKNKVWLVNSIEYNDFYDKAFTTVRLEEKVV